MIYFDNIIFSLQKAGGISVVWQNLLTEMIKDQIDFNVIEYPKADLNIFRKQLKLSPDKIQYRNFVISKTIEQLINVSIDLRSSPFIFHSSYYRLCSNVNSINVTTVHDFIYEKGFMNIGLKEKFRLWLNYHSIKNSDHIVCISKNTKKDLLNYIPDVDESKISVIYNGVSKEYRPLHSIEQQYGDYILFVGGRQNYKNFEFTVNAVRDTKYKLLICGNELSNLEKKMLDELLGLHRYKFKLRPSNIELNNIYNQVHSLIYPSSYEGFGIPVLEAQRAGCPVVALNTSSIPEIIGDGGLLLNSLDKEEFKSLIFEIDSFRNRERLIEAGLYNSSKYSWTKMANGYKSLYDKLLKQ